MRVIAIVGHQGSGKTAPIGRLIPELRAVDVVLVEGFKQLEWLRRVEVFRGQGTALAMSDPGIAAVAVPAGVTLAGYGGVKLPLEDTDALLEFILNT